jgi:hypothetical protein
MKRETEGAGEDEGGGDNEDNAVVKGSVAWSPDAAVEERRGTEAARGYTTPEDAALRFGCAEVDDGRTC